MMIKDLAYKQLLRVKEEQNLKSFSEAILKLVEIYDSTTRYVVHPTPHESSSIQSGKTIVNYPYMTK